MNAEVATEIDIKTEGEFARPNYLSEHSVRSWLLTTDHNELAFSICLQFCSSSRLPASRPQ